MKLGFAPYLISLLNHPSEKIIMEIVLSIINISGNSNSCCEILMDSKARLELFKIMPKIGMKLKEEVMWALTNLAADNVKTTKIFLDKGLVEEIINILKTPNISMSLLRILCWTISVLCHNYTEEYYYKIKPLLFYMKLLIELFDAKVTSDILSSIYYLTETSNPKIYRDIIEFIGIKCISKQLESNTKIVIMIFGNLCVLSDECANKLIHDESILEIFMKLLSEHKNEYDIAWMISNMAIGPNKNLSKIVGAWSSSALPMRSCVKL